MEIKDNEVTATWARETASSSLGKLADDQLKQCLKFIKGAVENNKFDTSINVSVYPVVIKELERRGFKVKVYTGDQRDGSYTSITW